MLATRTALIGWLRRRRTVWRAAWLLALSAGLWSPAGAQPERVWRYGMLASYPPFQVWPESGWPGGADLELLRLAAQRAGGRIEPVRYERFDGLLDDLASGRIDVASAVARTPEREPLLAFGPPYARIETVLVTRRGEGDVPLTADLAGRRIAVVHGYASATQVARLFPQAMRVSVPDVGGGLRALGEGRADLFIESATVIAETLDRLQLPDLRVARPVDLGAGELHLASGRAGEPQLAPLAAALETLGTAERQARIARWTAVTNVSSSLPLQLSVDDRRQLAGLSALRVAVVDGQAPFAWTADAGEPVGLSVDLLAAALSRLELAPPSLQPMAADAALEALRDGRVDLALGLPELATRRHGIGFAGPYIAHPLMLAAPRRSGLWSLEQMGGRRLAMPALQVPETLLRTRYPRVQPVDCETIVDCLGRVERGEADAMVADVVSLALALGGGGFGELQLVGTAGDLRHERGIAVSPARRPLVPLLQRALDAAVAEDLPALKSRWLERPPPQRLLRELLWRAVPWVAAAMLLIAGLWWWHAAGLRAEVARTRAARSQAERAAAASRRFLVFLAHEVRNSLHSVIAASELLRGQPGIAPSVTEPLGRSARSTLALLNGLLDRERLAAGGLTLDPGPVRLPALVASVVDEMTPLAEAAGVTLRSEPMPDRLLRVDALRVQQVLRNLLSNAIKYGGPGEVEIAHEIDGSSPACGVTLTVRDHGPGLSTARQQSAFEPFAEATRGRTDSAGLGLALGRDLARALGGDLTLETPAGRGLRARFRWQAECLETPGPTRPVTSRVLVVEDAEVYAMLLRRAFEAAGWQVEAASSVAEAHAHLAGASFDLLLTDLHLPDGDAQDVLAEARQPGLRRIVMTADVDAAPAGLRDTDALVAKGADTRLFVARILETVRPAVA